MDEHYFSADPATPQAVELPTAIALALVEVATMVLLVLTVDEGRGAPRRTRGWREIALSAWGTDILFDAAAVAFQNTALVNMTRWYSPAKILTMATADNASICREVMRA